MSKIQRDYIVIRRLVDFADQLRAEDVGGCLHEAVDARSDGALVGQVARDPALVLGAGATDERRVEDQAVLGSVS